MAKVAQTRRGISAKSTRLLVSTFLLACSLLAGWEVVRRPGSTVIILGGLALLFLIVGHQTLVLISLTTLALAIGSSSLVSSESIVSSSKFILLVAVALSGLLMLARGSSRVVSPGIVAWAFGLVFFAVCSTLYSVDPRITFEHSVALSLLFLSSLVAVPLLMSDAKQLITVLAAIAFVGTAWTAGGFLLNALGAVEGFQVGRFQGLFDNPNTMGYFLAPILPVVTILGLGQREKRKFFIVAGLFLFLALLLSGSRGGLLSSSFGTAVGFAIARNAKRVLVWTLMTGVAAATLISVLDIRIRPEGEGLLEAGTGSNRLTAWQDGLRLISERPLLGHGFGVTLAYFPEARTEGLYRGSTRFKRLHSSFLEAALELGWVGAGYLFLLATSGIWRGWRLARAESRLKWLAAALAGGIAGGLMEGVFEAGLLAAGGMLAFHFWILVGMVHSLARPQNKVQIT